MAEQRGLSGGKKSSVLRDAAALTTQLAAGLEKIGPHRAGRGTGGR
jgi:hypothetical protein